NSLQVSETSLETSRMVAETQRKNNADRALLIDFLKEFRSDAFKKCQRYVLTELPRRKKTVPIHDLPPAAKKAAETVCHYFDNLGLLAVAGAVDPHLVLAFM